MPNPDLILYNGRIYPDVNPRTRFEALAVWRGRVADLGSNRKVLRERARATETTNLRGHVVLPGLCDSHIHFLNYGMMLGTLDLTRTKSIDEMKRKVAKAGSSKTRGEWILGRGWDDEKLLEHRYPESYDLDEATSKPVFLKRICGHVAVANSAALSISGIDRNSRNPDGGLILRDSYGKPNGILKERAIELMENTIPQSSQESERALVLASRRLVKLGLTSLHCIVNDLHEFRALRMLKTQGKILQSIYAIIPLKLMDQLGSLGLATERGERGEGSFRIGGVKLYLDGSLGARTAALAAPYNDDPSSSGFLTMSRQELRGVAAKAREIGFQLCVHAIGDRAVDLAIRNISEVFGPSECREFRHRIEHASLLSPELILKIRRLGIIVSVQPRFIYSDKWAEQRIGPRRLRHLYPFSSITGKGILLAAGSDCPVENPNPFEGIWSAVTRPGLNGGEKLTVNEALTSYTSNACYASFCEDSAGTLEKGKRADLIVIDRDPFECSQEAIRRITVLRTMIGGVFVS